MTLRLFIQAISKYLAGLLLVCLLLFLPAGTLRFRNGWLLTGILFITMLLGGFVLMLFVSRVDYHLLMRFSFPLYLLTLPLLVLVKTSLGVEVNG